MKEVLNYDGTNYELAKKTMLVAKAEDEMQSTSLTAEEAYRKQYKYCEVALGKDATAKLLGKNINEIDLVELTLIVNAIRETYLERLKDQAMQIERDAFERPAIEAIEKVGNSIAMIQSAGK